MKPSLRYPALFALSVLPLTVHATNGYFMHGTSIKSQGMAGVGFALTHDSIEAAANPAALINLGNQYDLGISLFRPERSAEIEGNPMLSGYYDGNDDAQFWIPQAGFSRKHSDTLAYGVAMYANGGMNTSYTQNPFGAPGNAGVDLSQLFITGSLAIQLNEQNSLGLGVTHVYQHFSAEGLQSFSMMSGDPDSLTNRGYDSSTGWGVTLGWQGQVTDNLTLAARWASRIHTDAFSKYRGLFAEQGGFDIPESYGAGFALELNPQWTVAGDWERINYSDVRSVGNPMAATAPLGATDGPGFGWQDINVFKLGVSYLANDQLTLRAGVSHADQPIPSDQTMFNILAPGVIEDHLSLGATWELSDRQALTLSYTRALNEKVNGSNSLPTSFGGGEANLEMHQDIFGAAWQYRF